MPKKGELTPEQKKKAIAAGGTSALAIAAVMVFTPTWEGKENVPYFDSVKVKTVCYGETRVEMRRYSDKECLLLLEKGARQFQAGVLKINPRLSTDPYQWAAHTDFAYNVGLGNYAKSSVAKLYYAGREQEACHAIGKYVYAGKKVVRGLKLRRNGDDVRLGEIELCLTPYP
jgi:lysozyme